MVLLNQCSRGLERGAKVAIENLICLHQAGVDILDFRAIVQGLSFLRAPRVAQHETLVGEGGAAVDVKDAIRRNAVQHRQRAGVVEDQICRIRLEVGKPRSAGRYGRNL